MRFLGHVIDANGLQIDKAKVESVRDWPPPTTVREVQ